jgi:D-methionine transport system permease protein
MTIASTVFACLLGFPVGILLYSASPAGLKPRRVFYNVLSRVVNVFRSFPFIILMVLVMPLSRLIIGTSIGPTAVIIPLAIAAAPFVARITESALQEVDGGVILAANAMGSSDMQIIAKVLIPEALPSLVNCITITLITLIGYSAMGGAVGAGGLGQIGYQYGYVGYDMVTMNLVLALLVLLVFAVQFIGNYISRIVDHR